MGFADVLTVVSYAVVSLAIVGAALYLVALVAALVALSLRDLWRRARHGRGRR